MTQEDRDQLELELRQLPGVVLVAFGEREDAVLVELAVEEGTDGGVLAAEAGRLARMQIERPVVVEVLTRRPSRAPAEGHPASPLRVQFIGVVAERGGDGLAIHLAHRGRRVAMPCRAGDRIGVAEAVIAGLGELGLPVPYEPASVHLLSEDLGDGILVALRHRHLSGVRRGLATGRTVEDAVGRAVLNALNRYLQPREHGAGHLERLVAPAPLAPVALNNHGGAPGGGPAVGLLDLRQH